jgi:hypothetical protein
MSQSKKKIAELHKKANIEKKAKMTMYQIATDAIKTYLSVIGYAGILLDKIQKELDKNIPPNQTEEVLNLTAHKNFISEEAWRPISFSEYLQRRKSGRFLTWLFKKVFNKSFYERFNKKHKEIDKTIDFTITHRHDIIQLMLQRQSIEVQKFHIMQDLISEQKKPESFILQKYGLLKPELISIIEQIKKDLQGIKIEPDNVTEPMEQEHKS